MNGPIIATAKIAIDMDPHSEHEIHVPVVTGGKNREGISILCRNDCGVAMAIELDMIVRPDDD
jgi:hypothetical protein